MYRHTACAPRMRHRDNPRKRVLWGLTLVAIGTAFLLDRIAFLDLSEMLGSQARWWHFIPLLVALGGAISVISATSARQAIKGVGTVAIGLWVFACLEQWGGLTFANSWPIVLIVWGVEMLLRGFLGPRCNAVNEVAR
jgi:hypothetical protein